MVEVSGLLSNRRFASTIADLWKESQDPKKSTGVNRVVRAAVHRTPKLTKAEIAALVEVYRSTDCSLAAVARQFKVHRHTAARHLDRAGVGERRKRITPEQLAEAEQLYKEGWSLAKIGQRLGFSPSSINYQLSQAGVRLRSRPGR